MMTKTKLEKWRLRSRGSDHTKISSVWLYPELDCSSCIDDEASGEEQVAITAVYVLGHPKTLFPVIPKRQNKESGYAANLLILLNRMSSNARILLGVCYSRNVANGDTSSDGGKPTRSQFIGRSWATTRTPPRRFNHR